MPYAINSEIHDLAARERLLHYLDNCSLETLDEVAKFFTYYTFLIWDHQLYGEIYRAYTDDIVMDYGGGKNVQGLENVIRGTLEAKHNMTFHYKHLFTDIFAEGDPESGYRFIQSTTYFFPESGDSEEDFLNGKSLLARGAGNCMCECEVKKINGRWIITHEWMC